ncbi:hypothetical protein [Arthrobacter sp. Y81]|uniref:hypothetical protein n=1 Tax=Arthrobacter sp. Y81 TaxID=2058897 RepID=UPI001CA4C288|nr:hypothetical protein [Arthrobacter sp. Y81]
MTTAIRPGPIDIHAHWLPAELFGLPPGSPLPGLHGRDGQLHLGELPLSIETEAMSDPARVLTDTLYSYRLQIPPIVAQSKPRSLRLVSRVSSTRSTFEGPRSSNELKTGRLTTSGHLLHCFTPSTRPLKNRSQATADPKSLRWRQPQYWRQADARVWLRQLLRFPAGHLESACLVRLAFFFRL